MTIGLLERDNFQLGWLDKAEFMRCVMEKKYGDIDIVTNNELITFESFIKRLFELHYECNHEHYLSEIFMPFFRMCSAENTKIVPIFDDRGCGPRTENETKSKQRMKTICAPNKENGKYVVPDYIYVPLDYSFDNPKKAYLMIETKNPILIRDGNYYRDLCDYISEYYHELKAEIETCGYVIFTDGLTWMFLEMNRGKITESEEYKTIRLVNKFESYHKTNRISVKYDIGISGVEEEPAEWNELKQRINQLLTYLSKQDK